MGASNSSYLHFFSIYGSKVQMHLVDQSRLYLPFQVTKILYLSCRTCDLVTYNFHSSCKHMHLSFKSVCNKEHQKVICNTTSSIYSSKQDECFGKNNWTFLDFTCNYERMSGIFVPCIQWYTIRRKEIYNKIGVMPSRNELHKLTLKHSSVARYLAIEHNVTFSGQFPSRALAAILTIVRDATSLVAISASRNCKY